MSRTYKDRHHNRGQKRERRLSIRAVRRDPPDLRKLTQALVQLALEQAAAESAAQKTAGSRIDRGDQSDAWSAAAHPLG